MRFHITRTKKYSIFLGGLLVFGILIPNIFPALAQQQVVDIISNPGKYFIFSITQLLFLIVKGFGILLTNLTDLLILVAKYDKFGSESFVINAWVVVRDFANIFFIIALLFIAIATILRIEVYSAKRLLFKLILMAVLINFSRGIATFIVSISQVVMLFFVNSFASVKGALITNILLLDEYLSLVEDTGQLAQFDLSGLIFNVIIAGIFIAIGIFVIGTIVLLLVYRIIFLWILIILSPIAFLLHAVPGGTSYASQWWSKFSSNVISGPLMAFFLWLAFFAVSPKNGSKSIAQQFFEPNDGSALGLGTNASSITSIDNLLSFIIGIGLLMGGLMLTSQIGAAGGSLASNAVSKIQRTGTGALRGGGRLGYKAGFGTAKAVSRPFGYAADAARLNVGSRLATRFPTVFPKAAAIATGTFTKKGRERARSGMQAGILRAGGGKAGGRKAENITARARVARRKELQEQGSLEGHANLRAGFDSSMQQGNMQEAMIYASEMIEKEVGGVEGNIAKFGDKFKKQDIGGRHIQELEQKQSKKSKTYVPTRKEIEDRHGRGTGEYKPREENEMDRERATKVEKLEPKVFGTMLVKLQEDVEKRSRVAAPDPDKDDDTLTPLLKRIKAIRPDNEKLGSFGTTNIKAFTAAITSAIDQIKKSSRLNDDQKKGFIEPLQEQYSDAYDYHKRKNPTDYESGVTAPIQSPEVIFGGRSRSYEETTKTRQGEYNRVSQRMASLRNSVTNSHIPEKAISDATDSDTIDTAISELRNIQHSLRADNKLSDKQSEVFSKTETELENLRQADNVEAVSNQLEEIQQKLKEIEKNHFSTDTKEE